MEKEHREWWLFGLMAALIVAVVLLAWLDVPAFTSPAITYQSGETEPTAVLPISLNVATVEDLMQLDGMKENVASRIVTYRNTHGFFRSVDDLLQVEGVSKTRLEEWRPYLTL